MTAETVETEVNRNRSKIPQKEVGKLQGIIAIQGM